MSYDDNLCEEIQKLKAELNAPKRCLNCLHWQGDIKKARKSIEDYGLRVISPDFCSVDAAGCAVVLYNGVDVTVESSGWEGGGTAVVEFEPWFGCVSWAARGKP